MVGVACVMGEDDAEAAEVEFGGHGRVEMLEAGG